MTLRACVLMVAAVACGQASEPVEQARADVTFVRSPTSGQLMPDSATITLAGSQIVVAGKMMTGDPCRVIKGALVVTGERIELTMRSESDGSAGCVAVVARFAYTATITGVAPGTWEVEVRHLAFGTGGAEIVAASQIIK